jgi:PhzF family phenazine biosynthesis protein
MQIVPFKQVDVFTRRAFGGNPVAVVLDAQALNAGQMQAIARWTNLSETAFVLAPTQATASYRVARRVAALRISVHIAGTSPDRRFASTSALAAPMKAARWSFVGSTFDGRSKFVWM